MFRANLTRVHMTPVVRRFCEVIEHTRVFSSVFTDSIIISNGIYKKQSANSSLVCQAEAVA